MMIETTSLKAFAASLHLDCLGIAPAQLPIPPQTGDIPICPLAAGQGPERYMPLSVLPECQSIIVILFPYYGGRDLHANLSQYCRCYDYHPVVHRYLDRIISYLTAHYPDSRHKAIVDTSPLADRWLAYEAGLGFYGDNHCFFNDTYGSYFFIGSILTTIPFQPDTPTAKECLHCGACHAACPGQCFSSGTYDYQLCKSYLTQKKGSFTLPEQKVMAKTPLIFGCDVCQDVCPLNKTVPLTPLPEVQQDRIAFLSREELESLSNKQFQKAFGMRAFAWRGKKTLLRNMDCLEGKNGSDGNNNINTQQDKDAGQENNR